MHAEPSGDGGHLAAAAIDAADRTVFAVGDVQRLLELEGRINEIKALECLCLDPAIDSEARLREQLARVLPEEDVDRLREVAGELIRQSPGFQELLQSYRDSDGG